MYYNVYTENIMLKNKEKLYYYLQENSHNQGENYNGFTTSELAEVLDMQRSNISALLNELVKENKIIKSEGRPVIYYLSASNSSEDDNCFKKLVGYNSTLKNAVQLARAAILYPQKPLASLIYGEQGVGKSFFASIMYEYAVSSGIISEGAPFIKFNCSYYVNQEEELLLNLFGTNNEDLNSALNKASHGVLFIDHIECLKAKAKNRLVELVEHLSVSKDFIVICSTLQENNHSSDSSLLSIFPVNIYLPSLSERKLEERYNLVTSFFTDEAAKLKKKIKINAELLRCFLLYFCESNLKQLKNDIQTGCANAYVRAFNDDIDMLYVYVYDCPNYVRKGFLFYKEYHDEIESLIPQNFSYTFTADELKATKDNKNEKETTYEIIERKASELRDSGIDDENIANIISADIENTLGYDSTINDKQINTESLSKIVDKDIIEMVDDFISEASEKLSRVFSSSVFSSICIHVSNLVNMKKTGKVTNEKIVEVLEENKEEYTLCAELANRIESRFRIKVSIEDVVLMTMILGQDSRDSSKKKRPVLLIAMHGSVASSIVEVINTLIKPGDAYAFDLLLSADMNSSYEQMKRYCQQIENGNGILLLYDMGSIKKMADNIMMETGIEIKTIELPATLIALDCVFKLMEARNLDEAYTSISQNFSYGAEIQNSYRGKKDSSENVIITLCMTGKGTAMQMKKYIEDNMTLEENTSIVAMAVSDRKVLIENICRIMEESRIQCLIGTYDPQIYSIPFVPISSLFETPPEKLPGLLHLQKSGNSEVDFDKMYEYLDEQLENVSISKLKRHLRPAVIKIMRLVNERSIDIEIGLFIHIACSIGRIINKEPLPVNVRKNQILNSNKRLYNDIKEILSSLEKAMDISFSDDEIAMIINIIK